MPAARVPPTAVDPQDDAHLEHEIATVMTDNNKTTRRVYSAEELHRLRTSCSQPKLQEAIEERDGEDAELVKGKVWDPCTHYIIV